MSGRYAFLNPAHLFSGHVSEQVFGPSRCPFSSSSSSSTPITLAGKKNDAVEGGLASSCVLVSSSRPEGQDRKHTKAMSGQKNSLSFPGRPTGRCSCRQHHSWLCLEPWVIPGVRFTGSTTAPYSMGLSKLILLSAVPAGLNINRTIINGNERKNTKRLARHRAAIQT